MIPSTVLPRRSASHRWLAAVVLLAAGLRFVPIWFGLPLDEARPDEETAIGGAVAVLGGDLNPHFFHWPSLTFYLFAGCFSVASSIHRLLALDPARSVNEEYLVARGVVAVAGTLTVVVLFALTRRMADDATALVASFFLAVAPLHVRDSHFAMTDVLMTFFATLSLALLLRALDEAPSGERIHARAIGWFAVAGFTGGLAMSTKYSAAALIAAFAAAEWLWVLRARKASWRWHAWTSSAAFLLAFAFGFLLATPYALLDYRSFADGLSFDFTHLSTGHGANLGLGWTYHLTRSLPIGISEPVFVAAILGTIPMIRRHGRAALVVGAFCAGLYASVGRGHTVFFRYVLPLVPIACVSAAVAVTRTGEWLARGADLSKRAIVVLLAVAVALASVVNSAWSDLLLARTDTRVLAGRWLATRVKPDESLYDAGGTYARVSLVGVQVHRWSVDTFDPTANSFRDSDRRNPDWLVLPDSPLGIYTTVAPGLRALADEKYELALTIRATQPQTDVGAYDPQDAFFLPMSGFGAVIRPGPTLLIYRRLGLPKQ